jgi:hypothetical protein
MTRLDRIAFLILAVLATLPTLAQVAPSAAAARRAEILSSAPRGSAFAAGTRESYQVVVGLRAVARGSATPEARLEALGLPASDLVEVKGPFVVFQQTAPGATAKAKVAVASAVASIDRTPVYPVVLNPQTGGLGILPGVVIAKLRDSADATALAEANGLSIDYVAEMTRHGYFRVPAGGDPIAAAASLAKDPRVVTAYPEVREHFAVPH